MKIERKVSWLIISCLIIVGTLSMIQYYLVKNTYQLSKENYHAELRTEIGKFTHLPTNIVIEEKTQKNLKYFVRLFVVKKISKEALITGLKKKNDSVIQKFALKLQQDIKSNEILKDVKYKSQYDEITISFDAATDTLLSTHESPFVFLGNDFVSPNALLISHGNNTIVDQLPDDSSGQGRTIRLQILRSQYIDGSPWESEVWKRMIGVYLLAVSMIIAVIYLYYLVFRAMFRQKKLAEIKTDFANNITHELKTPLSSVGLILKSLGRDEIRSNPELTNELLSALNRQYIRIHKLVDFVLESAMTSTPNEIERQNVDMTAYLHNYVKDVRLEKHQFKSWVNPGKFIVFTNPEILNKILNNLVENAVKYSPDGTVVTLKSSVVNRKYRIEVTDKGPGIKMEYQSLIFDQFFRVPEYNQHNVKGLGLGLYLSKQAAISIGLSLLMESKPGIGSTFILELKYGS